MFILSSIKCPNFFFFFLNFFSTGFYLKGCHTLVTIFDFWLTQSHTFCIGLSNKHSIQVCFQMVQLLQIIILKYFFHRFGRMLILSCDGGHLRFHVSIKSNRCTSIIHRQLQYICSIRKLISLNRFTSKLCIDFLNLWILSKHLMNIHFIL